MKAILVVMSLLAAPQLVIFLKRKTRRELVAFCVTWALATAYAAFVAEGRVPPVARFFIDAFSRLGLAKSFK